MTVLSNEDILKELGLNIYIYPFRKKNLKGASYNLTASKLAWDLRTKESIYDVERNKLVIPKQTTALIETLESIWVSSSIAGTYHSKVALVSKGLSHVGTTLDPQYRGPSLIAIHNHSQENIEIIPGEEGAKPEEDKGETFVTLKFHYLETESSIEPGNNPGRPEFLTTYSITDEERSWLDEGFRNTPKALKEKLIDSPDYRRLLQLREQEAKKLNSEKERKHKIYKKKKNLGKGILISFVVLIVPVLLAGFLSASKNKLETYGWYDAAVNASYGLASVASIGVLTFAYQLFQTFLDEE